MNDDLPTPTARRGTWRVLGWAMLVAVVAAFGWTGWREYDYRAAVREARAAGFVFEKSPTPLAAIRADWRKRMLLLPPGADLAPLRPLLLRLDPTHLQARNCRHLDALGGRTELRDLDLSGSDAKDLAPLASLAQLHVLDLRGCTGVADLAPLAGLAQLRRLDLTGCTRVADLAPLAGLAQLQTVRLAGCTGIADLAPLAGLAQLQRLELDGCTGVADLAPLAGLTQLQQLYLTGCTGVADLAPLAGLAGLWRLDLTGCTGLGAEAVLAFKKSHPRVGVIGPDGREVMAQ